MLDDVVRAYDAAWNEPDQAARAELLAASLAEDAELVVGPSQVVQAGDGCCSSECLVSSAMVVVPEPAVKGRGAFC